MQFSAVDLLLKKIRRIQTLSLALELLISGAVALAGWSLTGAIADHYLFYHPIISGIIIGGITAFLISRSLVLFHARNDRENARAADRICNLQDRLTTYVEFRHTTHPFLEALTRESQERVSGIRPLKVARSGRTMFLPLLSLAFLLVSIAILPFFPVPAAIEAKKQDREAILAHANELESRVKELMEHQVTNPELQQLLKQMKQNANELRNPETDRTEALKLLNTWKEQLEKQERELQDADRKKLQQAWDQTFPDGLQSQNGSIPEDYESLLREYEKMMKDRATPGDESSGTESGKGNGDPADLTKLKEALKEYQSKRAAREKAMAELKKSMEEARSGIGTSAHKRKVVTDSRVKDRDLDKSEGGVEDGPGTTNKDIGPQRFSTKKKQAVESLEDRTRASYEQLYTGQRIDAGKDPFFLESEWNFESSPRMVSIRTFGLESDVTPGSGDSDLVEQTGRESGIRKEKVPARYRKIVQEYFQRIQPE